MARPLSRGFVDLKIIFLIKTNIVTETKPLSKGLANQDAAILAKAIHFTYDYDYKSLRKI